MNRSLRMYFGSQMHHSLLFKGGIKYFFQYCCVQVCQRRVILPTWILYWFYKRKWRIYYMAEDIRNPGHNKEVITLLWAYTTIVWRQNISILWVSIHTLLCKIQNIVCTRLTCQHILDFSWNVLKWFWQRVSDCTIQYTSSQLFERPKDSRDPLAACTLKITHNRSHYELKVDIFI